MACFFTLLDFDGYRKSKFLDINGRFRYGYVECDNQDWNGNLNIGSRCYFYCNANYELEGTSRTSCNKKGSWTSRSIPECVRRNSRLIAGKKKFNLPRVLLISMHKKYQITYVYIYVKFHTDYEHTNFFENFEILAEFLLVKI
jgi:hypothetical protein